MSGKKELETELEKWKNLSDKHLELFLLMTLWMNIKQDQKSIATWLYERSYRTIAIYGMGYVGECLIKDLKGSTVEIKYAIDKKKKVLQSGMEMLSPDEELQKVDAVIVTAIASFDLIQGVLLKKTDMPIVSFADILLELDAERD